MFIWSNLGWEVIVKFGCEPVPKMKSKSRQRSSGSTGPTGIIPGQYEEQDRDPKIGKDHVDPPVLQGSYLASIKRRTETPR